MRRYLKEFLSDRRVIETSRLIWWPVLNLIILTKRPGPKGQDYATIWNKERDEGPLKTITRAQAESLAQHLSGSAGDRVVVDWAMRYGNPAVAGRIQALLEEGCDRILLVPLYPQYSAATSATACDKAFRALMDMRWQPAIRVSPPYHDDPVYIDALVIGDEARPRRSRLRARGDPGLVPRRAEVVPAQGRPLSLPLRQDLAPDARGLRLARRSASASASSRASAPRSGCSPTPTRPWRRWPESGVKRLAIVAPGFSADCLETLEEIDGENRHYFEANGGEQFAYLPCLNDREEGMRVIRHIVERELMGWI